MSEQPERDFYAELADTLHAIADDIATLAGRGLPELSYVAFEVQPFPRESDDDKIRVIDAIGEALVGRPSETELMVGGTYHYRAKGYRGPVHIDVYAGVTSPEERAMEAEMARLRERIDRRRRLRRGAEGGGPEQPSGGDPS